ncbi:MAG: HIT family protein [Parvularculaceae bacterium]
MSLNAAYDDSNVFARILRGELPCVKIFEDDRTLSFMDVFPQSRGHCLVVPKVRAVNLFDIGDEDLGALVVRTRMIARAVRDGLKPDGVFIAQFNGEEAGQSVFHLHFHVIPRYSGEVLARHGAEQADARALESVADKIRSALA